MRRKNAKGPAYAEFERPESHTAIAPRYKTAMLAPCADATNRAAIPCVEGEARKYAMLTARAMNGASQNCARLNNAYHS